MSYIHLVAAVEITGGGMKPKHVNISPHKRAITALKYSSNTKYYASSGADLACCIFNSNSHEKIQVLSGIHSEGINDLEWLHHLSYLATASDDKQIVIWDIETGQDLATLSGHQNFVFSLTKHPFQNLLLSCSEDETIKMWDIRTRASCVLSVEGHSEPITSIQFHPSGDDFSSCSYDGIIRLWDLRNGACRRTLIHPNRPPVSYIRYSPNGKYLLTSSFDNTLRLIRPLQPLQSDSNLIKYGNMSTVAARNTYRCATGVIPEIKRYTGHVRQAYCSPIHFGSIDISPFTRPLGSEEEDKMEISEGRSESLPKDVVISGSDDGKVHIWELDSQELICTLHQPQYTSPILALEYQPERQEILCNGGEQDILVYSLTNSQQSEETSITDFQTKPSDSIPSEGIDVGE